MGRFLEGGREPPRIGEEASEFRPLSVAQLVASTYDRRMAAAGTRWVRIGPLADLRFDPGACVAIGDRELAVFPVDGGFTALDNSCTHQGAALAEGQVEGTTVSCPWHGWRFDLRTGHCLTIPDDRTRVYPVRETDGHLEVELPTG